MDHDLEFRDETVKKRIAEEDLIRERGGKSTSAGEDIAGTGSNNSRSVARSRWKKWTLQGSSALSKLERSCTGSG
ncbi:MAG: hypothetical protein JRH13_09405 [Deltaproteobacteria bacterium]|nr:hypothetical protein [Deltaproteobacteria bacterium]MBW2129566.1 hypothetical protein [Deltaproteobacteria bacterium]